MTARWAVRSRHASCKCNSAFRRRASPFTYIFSRKAKDLTRCREPSPFMYITLRKYALRKLAEKTAQCLPTVVAAITHGKRFAHDLFFVLFTLNRLTAHIARELLSARSEACADHQSEQYNCNNSFHDISPKNKSNVSQAVPETLRLYTKRKLQHKMLACIFIIHEYLLPVNKKGDFRKISFLFFICQPKTYSTIRIRGYTSCPPSTV